LEEFELPKFELQGGDIFPGDVLELHDHTERNLGYLFSGDFLLVRSIVENVKTEEVILRGYRLRRCAYLQPLFDRRFNDLFMLIEVSEHDPKPRFVQGLEDVSPTEVIQKRRCVFTHLDHELMNVSHTNKFAPARVTKEDKLKEWIFEHGTLICRWVHVVELHPTGQSCGGEARRMYKREATSFTNNESLTQPLVKTQSDPASGPLHNRKRVQSDEDVIFCPAKRHQRLPEKTNMMSLGDGFCGAGGVSQGAREAGYKIAWGLENEAYAMAAYKKNFPEAMHLEMDAHDFPDIAKRCTQGCDHLHMSCPCCFWSEAHTSDGKNDEKNMMTLYTVEAWLKALKPKAFSLEQAPGLLKLAKHRVYFRKLINDILSRGYAVRWKIQDQAWFGIPQHRRRLVFIGVKIGIPLPPFPAPIYGPPKSGLKRYVTIEDSLKVIERQAMSFRTDIYHQPLFEKRLDLPSIDPHVNLAKCVTTSGGDNVHYSGKRANTVRELASFQGLPPDFKFAGSVTEAKKQCGNTWPAKANKVYFALWAAHREAFDNGLINAEDEILDLYAFLEAKGVDIPKPP
ncbi:S-adenosyl-L-methionine-dependent methyltransferase, partial [Ophiobolus disseminans]